MVYLKSLSAMRTMLEGGQLLCRTLELLENNIRAGITTKELNKIAQRYIISNGAHPSFLGYSGFPASVCTSVNEVVIHGIPSEQALQEGDIVSLDVGVYYKGFHTDAARTFAVGEVAPQKRQLMQVTQQSFFEGLKLARAGYRISDISAAIESYIRPFGYGIVRSFTGHGVGRDLHEAPEVPNFGKPGRGLRITDGLTIAIEPMVNLGGDGVEILEDGWTTVTRDRSCSAHYENTVCIAGGEPVVITLPDAAI